LANGRGRGKMEGGIRSQKEKIEKKRSWSLLNQRL